MIKKILILCLALLPLVAQARRKSKQNGQNPSALLANGYDPRYRNTRMQDKEAIHFDSLYFEALSRNLQGKPSESLALVNEALQVDSLSAPALYLRSKLYRTFRNPQALTDARRAAEIDTTNYWYTKALGDIYLGQGRMDSAIVCYERLVRLNPTKSDPHYTLAELYLRTDNLSKGLDILNRIEELDGVNPHMTMQKFYILQELKRSDEAFDEYHKLIKRYPYEITYRLQLGELQMKSGLIQQAKQTYDEAANIDPDNAYLWIAQSNYYSITGNQTAADSLVHNALLNANLDITTKIDILTEYLKTSLRKVAQEKEKAQDTTAIALPSVDALFETVSTMHPTAAEVYDLHSDYLSAIGQDSAAVVQMQFAVDLKPSEEKYWGKLLSCAAQTDNYPLVMELAEKAQAVHPKLTEIYLTKAFVYQRKQMNDSALLVYQEALDVIDAKEINTISRIYGFMGDLHHEMGQKEKCYECYDQALKYNQLNYMVLNNYAYFLCIDNGDLNKAESMAAKVVMKFPDEPTYLDTYAWIYYLQGKYSLAKFYQEKAIEKSEGEPSGELKAHYEAILKALNEQQ